jgi:hypothetical protein
MGHIRIVRGMGSNPEGKDPTYSTAHLRVNRPETGRFFTFQHMNSAGTRFGCGIKEVQLSDRGASKKIALFNAISGGR